MIHTKRLKKFDRAVQESPTKSGRLYYVSQKTISDRLIDDYLELCLAWCCKKFGKIRGRSIPSVEWEWSSKDIEKNYLALYDSEDNVISLKITGHRNFFNISKTIIHEYIHYIQPVHGNWYERYDKKHGYNNNPYEVEAYYISELYAVTCTNWIFTQI